MSIKHLRYLSRVILPSLMYGNWDYIGSSWSSHRVSHRLCHLSLFSRGREIGVERVAEERLERERERERGQRVLETIGTTAIGTTAVIGTRALGDEKSEH
ncbi:hypothetical protein ACLOJK_034674 [Asimina triloba]